MANLTEESFYIPDYFVCQHSLSSNYTLCAADDPKINTCLGEGYLRLTIVFLNILSAGCQQALDNVRAVHSAVRRPGEHENAGCGSGDGTDRNATLSSRLKDVSSGDIVLQNFWEVISVLLVLKTFFISFAT